MGLLTERIAVLGEAAAEVELEAASEIHRKLATFLSPQKLVKLACELRDCRHAGVVTLDDALCYLGGQYGYADRVPGPRL